MCLHVSSTALHNRRLKPQGPININTVANTHSSDRYCKLKAEEAPSGLAPVTCSLERYNLTHFLHDTHKQTVLKKREL